MNHDLVADSLAGLAWISIFAGALFIPFYLHEDYFVYLSGFSAGVVIVSAIINFFVFQGFAVIIRGIYGIRDTLIKSNGAPEKKIASPNP
jgi:hypothetical protein